MMARMFVEVNYPEVSTYADLPSASVFTGKVYIVRTQTGLLLFRNKPGLYRSDGASWTRMGADSYLRDEVDDFLNGKANTSHAHAQGDVTGLVASLSAKENSITAGSTSQYFRGDKTFQTRDRLLFTHFVNAGNNTTEETDLFTNSITAPTFVTNGDMVVSKTTGSFAGSGTATRQLRAYFATTLIFDTGALSISGNSDWRMEMSVIRVSNTVVRCSVALNTGGASTSVYTKYTEITGLNLTTTAYPLKSTGTAAGVGAATNDIVAKMGFVEYKNFI